MRLSYLVLLVGLLVGCDRPQLQLPMTEKVSPKARQVVESAWPKVKKSLPGLVKYAGTLKAEEVIDQLGAPDAESRRVTVRLQVPEGKSAIPSEYKASGQVCSVDISPDAKWVTVTKDPCISVMLDRRLQYSGGYPLKMSLL